MIQGVHVSSSEMRIQTKPGQPGPSMPALKNNQVVKATVLQVSPPDQAELMVNGRKMDVTTQVRLNPGEEIQLRVSVQKDAFLLKLLGEPPSSESLKNLSFLKSALSGSTALQDLFQPGDTETTRILDTIALKSGTRDDNFLPRLLEKSGVMLENKLGAVIREKGPDGLRQLWDRLLEQDFKGLALKQLAAGGSETAKPAGIAQTIETLQLLNHLGTDSGRLLLPFPILADAGFNLGQLLIDTGGGTDAREGDRVISVSLLLDMSHLGPVRADFSVLNRAITGRFLVGSEEVRSFLAANLPELEKRLEALSFQVHRIDCQVVDPAATSPNVLMESLFKNQDDGVLNIVI